jgi:hypothetical protein
VPASVLVLTKNGQNDLPACVLYFGEHGFLDGRAGFQYAILHAIYEYVIVLKVRESQGKS